MTVSADCHRRVTGHIRRRATVRHREEPYRYRDDLPPPAGAQGRLPQPRNGVPGLRNRSGRLPLAYPGKIPHSALCTGAGRPGRLPPVAHVLKIPLWRGPAVNAAGAAGTACPRPGRGGVA